MQRLTRLFTVSFASLLIALAAVFCRPLSPDADPFDAANGAFGEGNYLLPISSLRGLEAHYLGSKAERYFHEALGTYLSFVGDHAGALGHFDRNEPPAESLVPTPMELEELTRCQAHDAEAFIAEMARSRRVVLINEAHHVAQHRAFTKRLLPAMRGHGFGYLALEALGEDPSLHARGYPELGRSGYYLREPVFGELVRDALALGFRLTPYEQMSSDRNRRDLGQAELLLRRVPLREPRTRLLVHAGYGHVMKRPREDWIPMGARLWALSGIEPLSIDQTFMSERGQPERESPYYRFVADRGLLRSPTVFVCGGKPWVKPSQRDVYDLQVFHPRTKSRDGRPTWRRLEGSVAWPVADDLCRAARPCLVQAFLAGESGAAVPADQVLVSSTTRPTTLLLRRGRRYVVRARDTSGRLLKEIELGEVGP